MNLRLLQSGDIKHFAKWWRDKDLIALTSGAFDEISDAEVARYFETMKSISDYHFMIEVDGETIGHVSLSKREGGWYETQIVIGEKNYLGKGYGSEAIKKVIEFAKNKNITKIYLEVRPDNLRAIKAYEKCGFVESRIVEYPQNKNLPKTLRMELINNL